ncbi:MAG: PspA/IM30 family protein [Planctomyces sp.]|nr:PspA/IM30 family protein [Planctomyces sp.]
MNYFSRLTDIVTCNLTALLEEAEDPHAALEQVCREMREGVAGAQRSAATAVRNLEKVENEIAEQQSQAREWVESARKQLAEGDENQARQSLMRKKEVEALIAGLEQQRQAALSTRNHLQTTLAALQARLHEAERRLEGFAPDQPAAARAAGRAAKAPPADDWADVDRELAELRKQLGQ